MTSHVVELAVAPAVPRRLVLKNMPGTYGVTYFGKRYAKLTHTEALALRDALNTALCLLNDYMEATDESPR